MPDDAPATPATFGPDLRVTRTDLDQESGGLAGVGLAGVGLPATFGPDLRVTRTDLDQKSGGLAGVGAAGVGPAGGGADGVGLDGVGLPATSGPDLRVTRTDLDQKSGGAAGVGAAAAPAPTSRRLTAEIWIVLGLSLGQSAVYAVVNIVARLTEGTPLAQQSVALNPTRAARPYLDLTYQLLDIGFALVPVALALFLLSSPGRRALRSIGFDLARPARDLATGIGLAAAIGIPGIGLYLGGRALGITVQVTASALDTYWWTVPILILAALRNALVEEVVVVGYLMTRLEELRWPAVRVVAASALLRGAYHLYQGFGPFLGNIAMGVVFAEYFRRRRRTMPLVVAHTVLDVVAFVGYALLPPHWRSALGIA